jgi:hypothetical protein
MHFVSQRRVRLRKSIVIGVPTLGTVSSRWALHYGQITGPMNGHLGHIWEVGFEVGVARNRIVAQALKHKIRPTHVLFIDDDVIVPSGCLLQLLSHNLDIVGGYYFSKGLISEPLAYLEAGEGILPYDPNRPVTKVWGIGMGVTLIKTDVFRVMQENLDLGTDAGGNPKWFYTSGDLPGEDRITEDLYFCQLARAAGFDVHIDSSQHCFGWHFCKEKQVGFPLEQWDEFIMTGSSTWTVPDIQGTA